MSDKLRELIEIWKDAPPCSSPTEGRENCSACVSPVFARALAAMLDPVCSMCKRLRSEHDRSASSPMRCPDLGNFMYDHPATVERAERAAGGKDA